MRIPGSSIRLDIPEASLRRLPIYYRSLQDMRRAGVSQVSCAEIARVLGFDPTQVRKDIEMTGIVGKPRVGYGLCELLRWIENFLGWNRPKAAALVGAGSLGSALLGYEKFRTHGMQIVAAFDVDPEKIGQRIHGREVQPLLLLPDFVRQVIHPEGDRVGLPTLFFPMQRIERLALDEPSGSIPSLANLFEQKVGLSLKDYLAQFV